jgi:ferritin
MISKKLQDALNAQINAEMWSAYLYLSMSVEAESKGLKGFGYSFTYKSFGSSVWKKTSCHAASHQG